MTLTFILEVLVLEFGLHRSMRPVRLEPSERKARATRGLATDGPTRLTPKDGARLSEAATRVCLVPTPVALGGRGLEGTEPG